MQLAANVLVAQLVVMNLLAVAYKSRRESLNIDQSRYMKRDFIVAANKQGRITDIRNTAKI